MKSKNYTPVRIAGEFDRAILRNYLTERWRALARARKKARGEAEEEGFFAGWESEIYVAFDELLGEEPPQLDGRGRVK